MHFSEPPPVSDILDKSKFNQESETTSLVGQDHFKKSSTSQTQNRAMHLDIQSKISDPSYQTLSLPT
jgi:hypothetical protein